MYATTELNEPGRNGYRTIWYLWTPLSDLNVTVTTNGTLDSNVNLNAYQVNPNQPSCSQMAWVAGYFTNGVAVGGSSISFPAAAGTTYAFAVGSANSTTGNGSVTLSLTGTSGGPWTRTNASRF